MISLPIVSPQRQLPNEVQQLTRGAQRVREAKNELHIVHLPNLQVIHQSQRRLALKIWKITVTLQSRLLPLLFQLQLMLQRQRYVNRYCDMWPVLIFGTFVTYRRSLRIRNLMLVKAPSAGTHNHSWPSWWLNGMYFLLFIICYTVWYRMSRWRPSNSLYHTVGPCKELYTAE